ncbi:hypothetical protein Bbelb_096320 [Branchiostoma belcheri]|nr:hypothetical protein Bbelb_096320 [Branchiostoma belcheri]
MCGWLGGQSAGLNVLIHTPAGFCVQSVGQVRQQYVHPAENSSRKLSPAPPPLPGTPDDFFPAPPLQDAEDQGFSPPLRASVKVTGAPDGQSSGRGEPCPRRGARVGTPGAVDCRAIVSAFQLSPRLVVQHKLPSQKDRGGLGKRAGFATFPYRRVLVHVPACPVARPHL